MIKRFLTLHLNLIKYFRIEFSKKKSLKLHIYFLRDIGKEYLRVMFLEYKRLFLIFNKEYQNQKKQYKKYQDIKKDLNRALRILRYIDEKMAKTGMNRQRRRQFWRDFFKDGQVREDVFDDLLKEIEQIK